MTYIYISCYEYIIGSCFDWSVTDAISTMLPLTGCIYMAHIRRQISQPQAKQEQTQYW